MFPPGTSFRADTLPPGATFLRTDTLPPGTTWRSDSVGPGTTWRSDTVPPGTLSGPSAAASIAEALMDRADPRRYIGVLLARWWLLLLILLLGTAIGAVDCLLTSPLYRAVSRYEIVSEVRAPLPNQAYYQPDYIKLRNRQILILTGGNLRTQVAAKLTPRWSKVLPNLNAAVGVRPVREIETMIDISVDAAAGEYARDYLQELLKAYQEFARANALEVSQTALRNLWVEKQQLANDLEDAQSAMIKFQKDHNIRFSEAKQQIDDQFLASLVQRQNALRMERTMMETQFPRIQNANAATIQDVMQLTMETHQATTGAGLAAAPAASRDTGTGLPQAAALVAATGTELVPGVGEATGWQRLEENVARLESEYQDNLATYKPTHPKMKSLARTIEMAKRELRFSSDSGLKRMKGRYEALKLQEAALEEAAKTWRSEISLSVADRASYDSLRAKVDHLKQLHDQVFTRILDSSALNVDTMTSHEIEPPTILPDIVWPNRFKIMTFSILAALGIGLALVFLLDFLDTSMMDVLAIEERLALPHLSSIPNWEHLIPNLHLKNAQVVVRQDKANVPSEAYRSLRTSLDNLIGGRPFYALAITSVDANEGKSFTAINLAVTFSWTHRKVLLVDGDMRRGRLHEPFKVNPKPGLLDLLTGEVDDWHQVTRPTAYENLTLIPVGHYNDSAPELLESGRLRSLLAEWSQEYSLVIFDTAPIGRVVDGAMIGRACDGVLLVARHGQATFAGVRHAIHRLEGAHVVGFCMNGIDIADKHFGYFNYSGYFRRFARYGQYAYANYYDRYRYGQYGYSQTNDDLDSKAESKRKRKRSDAPPSDS